MRFEIVDSVLVVVAVMIVGLASAALNASATDPECACPIAHSEAWPGDPARADEAERGKLALHEPPRRRI